MVLSGNRDVCGAVAGMKRIRVNKLTVYLTLCVASAWNSCIMYGEHPFRSMILKERAGKLKDENRLSGEVRSYRPKIFFEHQLLGSNQNRQCWHAGFPTTGLAKQAGYFPPCYPFIPHYFTLHELAPHQGASVRLVLIDTGVAGYNTKCHYQHRSIRAPFNANWKSLNVICKQPREISDCLPVPPPLSMLIEQECNPAKAHGTHTYGLIAAKQPGLAHKLPSGVSPRTETIMIKAFNDEGVSDKATLIEAVKKAVTLHPDIVLLSLKIDEADTEQSPDSIYLDALLQVVPYTIAAAGNDKKSDPCKLAYPARLPAVTMSVGAFGVLSDGQPVIAPFSQCEPGKGPTFLAPGIDIISTAVPATAHVSPYMSMSGTSAAAALVAGCLALALGEFRHDFSKDQILRVFYASGLTMKSNSEWCAASLYGVLDMRMALFMLHVLKAAKKGYALIFLFISISC